MWVLQALTFLLPWVVTPGTANPFLEGKEILLLGGGWGLSLWTLGRASFAGLPGRASSWLTWFMCYVVGCGVWHFHWLYLWRTPDQTSIIYNSYIWNQTLSVVMAFILVRMMAMYWMAFPSVPVQLAQWLCLSATLVALYALGQSGHLDQWFMPMQGGKGNLWKGVYAGFGNPSYLAVYLSTLTPLFFVFKSRRYVLYLAVVAGALYVSTVRYAWVLSVIGIGSYCVSRWWTSLRGMGKVVVLAGLAVTAGVIMYVSWGWAQGDERWPLWVMTFHRLQSVPLETRPGWLGYGLGSFAFIMKETPYIWVHNEWLQVMFELGALGVGLLAVAVGVTTRRAWRAATQSQIDAGWFGVWMALLASTLIHFPWHLAPTIWTGVCAWAVIDRNRGEV